MNCYDVFIIVLVTVIFQLFILYDHLVTNFELSHILTNTLNNVFLLRI